MAKKKAGKKKLVTSKPLKVHQDESKAKRVAGKGKPGWHKK